MPKYNQLLMNRYSDTMFFNQTSKKTTPIIQSCLESCNDYPIMSNDTISRQKRGIISKICNFQCGPTES